MFLHEQSALLIILSFTFGCAFAFLTFQLLESFALLGFTLRQPPVNFLLNSA
jgi:hypothetical protein